MAWIASDGGSTGPHHLRMALRLSAPIINAAAQQQLRAAQVGLDVALALIAAKHPRLTHFELNVDHMVPIRSRIAVNLGAFIHLVRARVLSDPATTAVVVNGASAPALQVVRRFMGGGPLPAQSTTLTHLEVKGRSVDVTGCVALQHVSLKAFQSCGEIRGIQDCRATLESLEYIDGFADLDLTGFAALKDLNVDRGTFATLTLHGCASLSRLTARTTYLNKLCLRDCADLAYLDVSATGDIESLDLRPCAASLRHLKCAATGGFDEDECRLSSIDLAGCHKLQTLNCTGTKVVGLDLRDCAGLQEAAFPKDADVQLPALEGGSSPQWEFDHAEAHTVARRRYFALAATMMAVDVPPAGPS